MMFFEDVRVVKGTRHILDGVTLQTEPGTVTVVLGVNGAGKSSLVRLMSGEWTPTSGSVCWNATPIAHLTPRLLAQQRAIVNQQTELSFDFSVRDVVEMGRYPHRERGASLIVEQALEEMELTRLASMAVTSLSGGERRRVWLARALAQLAEARKEGKGLLVLDEPTAHLDLRHQERLMAQVRTLADEGVSVFIVLHELNHAARIADRVVLMDRGRVVRQGPTAEVMTPDLLSRVFGLRLRQISGFSPRWQPEDVPAELPFFEPESLTLSSGAPYGLISNP